ncbi:MAG TPA: hybrid sensor histidine kinase/response regulator [Chloroflexi bacterium]|nr:hybrid sensor histidine kinase/response regulator [Chloroflexota bacterium]
MMTRQNILVVDDHEPLLMAIRGIMETAGDYQIFTATDGIEALKVMDEIRPDLIIADIMMPRMDGFALYKAIRAREEWVSIPFIFLTAKAERADRLRGKELGAEDYLTKPFDPDELLIAVRSRLQRAQAIQEAAESQFEQLKQQIANVFGHELRTPLTYVRGYTELALEEVSDTEALQSFLSGIKRGTDRLNRLVEDLMLMVQVDTGRSMEEYRLLKQVYVDITPMLETVIEKHCAQAENRGILLEMTVEPDLPPVQICETLFVNALGRLVDNAIKFSREFGKRVTIHARAAGDWVEIAVSDEGIGIAASEIPHLFERFRQIDRDRMEQQGIGLGLALAKDLIALHGGEITVKSTPGVGSTFTIRLPAVKADSSA